MSGIGGPLDVRAREIAFWRLLVQARYLGIVAVALLALLPLFGGSRPWLCAGLLAVGLPLNAAHDLVLRRDERLLPSIAIADQVLVVGILVFDTELLPAAVMAIMVANAASAVAFGRRFTAITAAGGLAAISIVMLVNPTDDALALVALAAVGSAFLVTVVGGVAQMERDLRDQYRELVGGVDAVVWEQRTSRPSTLYVTGGAEKLLGYPSDVWGEAGSWSRFVHPDDRQDIKRAYRTAIRKGEDLDIDYRMIAADGRVVHVNDRMRVEVDEIGRPLHVRGVMVDVSETRQAQHRASQFSDLADNIDLALFVLELIDGDDDRSLEILALNPAAAELTGLDPNQVVGEPLDSVVEFPADHDEVLANLAHVVRSGETWQDDHFRLAGDTNAFRFFSATAFPLPGRAVAMSVQDITARVRTDEVLRYQALHDSLTGLPNRLRLMERLEAAVRGPGSSEDRKVALLVMDVDQFKDVNDALGHARGDHLLIELSRRLYEALPEADVVVRLGGDEFAVLLIGADVDTAIARSHEIREALEAPFELEGIAVQASAPVGIAVFPDHGTDPELLVQHADVAMYVAKRTGSGVTAYAPSLDGSSVRRLTLMAQLRQAIENDELTLHYQPSIDLRTGKVHGVEALARWDHPEFGMVPPSEFIELAEVSGAITPLTKWVITTALAELRRWHESGHELRMSCNLSVRNLHDRGLVSWIAAQLQLSGITPDYLKLEITESELMQDPTHALEVLGRLRALGTETSIDDFGTGYSSLAYLKSLPIDELKIDKSFVDHMATDAHDLAIVRSTIDLSHDLGLTVTAEGVEDLATLRRLAELGCDRAQGYYVSRPVPASQLAAWLDDAPQRDDLVIVLP